MPVAPPTRTSAASNRRSDARPLLKWAGGKRQLLPVLRRLYPEQFGRYIEPFFGSGAVFFDLHARGAFERRTARLIDANLDLVGCYLALRRDIDSVIRALRVLDAGHRRTGDSHFYSVRDERFNQLREPLLTEGDATRYTAELAAMFIYLNRTGFNGLFRVNGRGRFNVPAGRYTNPTICDPEHLRWVARALTSPNVAIEHASFERGLDSAGAGDFVYCDPPYAPLTATASFTSYTAAGFTSRDQERLQQAVLRAATRGAVVLVSNSNAAIVQDLYGSAVAQKAGFSVHRVPARRAINSRASARGPVEELLITNAAAPHLKKRQARRTSETLVRRTA